MQLSLPNQIILENKSLAYSTAHRLTGDQILSETAIDNANDRFLLTMERKPELCSQGGYLSVVRSCALDERRKQTRRNVLLANFQVADKTDETPYTRLADSDQLQRLNRCIKGLLAGKGKLIQLRFFEELPLEEIAKVIDKSLATVKRYITEAIKSLNDCMADTNPNT
jgi:RNA polymerase sigma factor (sigma-70 family)